MTHEYLFYMLSLISSYFIYFVARIVPPLVTEQSFSWLLCTCDVLLSMWLHLFICLFVYLLLPYVLALQDTPGSSCIFLAPFLKLTLSPKSAGFFYWENGLRNKIFALCHLMVLLIEPQLGNELITCGIH